jgi:hypothetical protein
MTRATHARAQTPLSRSTRGDPFAAPIETDVQMITGRLTPLTDDHGDQFPGALPPVTEHRPESAERLVRMRADYTRKANCLIEAGRDDLARELAETFTEESGAARRPAGRRTPTRSQDGRRPAGDNRLRRLARRFDRYTLDVFNAGTPYRRYDG